MVSRLKIASNTFYQLLGKVFTTLSTLLITVLITRLLGAESFGEYSIVISFVTPFFIMSDFGLNAVVSRDFVNNEEEIKRRFKSIIVLRGLIALLLMIIGVFGVYLANYSLSIKLSILVGLLWVFAQSIFSSCNIVFQAKLSYQYPAISQLVGSLVSLVLVFLAIVLNFKIIGVVLGFIIGNFVSTSISIYFSKDYLSRSTSSFDILYWKKTLSTSFPIGSALIFNVLMVACDRVILSFMVSPYSVGIYSLAYKVFDVILVFPTFFMNAMYPVFVKAYAHSIERFAKSLSFAISLMTISYLTSSFLVIVFAKKLIPMVWGYAMQPAVAPLIVLMAGSIMFFLSSPLSWALVSLNKQKSLPLIYITGFLLNVILNIIFIPKYNYMASAYITIFTEFIVLVLVFYLGIIRQKLPLRLTLKF